MIKEEHPPTQQSLIDDILTKLNLKSIDQLLQNQQISVEYLAKATNTHTSIIIKILFELKNVLNQPEDIIDSLKYSLKIKDVVNLWVGQSDQNQNSISIYQKNIQKIKDIQIGSSQIVQIIGRANSGKSYFMFSLMLYCIQKGLKVILLDSNRNYEDFVQFICQKYKSTPELAYKILQKLIHFKFGTLSQFSILIHNLGNQLIAQKKNQNSFIKQGVIVFIDCLSRVQLADPDTDQQNSTMDFDIIQKLKRLLVTFSTRACTIVYTNRIPTAYTLFHTFYKNEKNRPRCKNNNAKIWDSIANKTICVDYTKTMGLQEVKKLHFTKDFSNQVFTFQRKLTN